MGVSFLSASPARRLSASKRPITDTQLNFSLRNQTPKFGQKKSWTCTFSVCRWFHILSGFFRHDVLYFHTFVYIVGAIIQKCPQMVPKLLPKSVYLQSLFELQWHHWPIITPVSVLQLNPVLPSSGLSRDGSILLVLDFLLSNFRL